MRNIVLTIAPLLLLTTTLSSQGVFSNKTQAVLEKVIREYPEGFHNNSWTSPLFEAEGFEQAKTKYHEVFGQIRNSIITTGAQKTFILTGQYEDPLADKKFSHVVFSLLPSVGEMKKLKVELSLREEGNAWKISLSVYDNELKESQGAQGVVTAN